MECKQQIKNHFLRK